MLALATLAALVYAGLYLYVRLRYGDRGIALLASDDFPTPARITLRRDTAPEHFHPDANAAVARSLVAEGFFPVSHFSIDEIPILSVHGLYHPGERLLAAVCDHPVTPGLYEVSAHYADGRVLRATNNPLHRPELSPPSWRTVFERRLAPAAAVAAVRRPGDDDARIAISDENFVEVYERTYAVAMDFILKQDCVPEDLIRANAATYGVDDALSPRDMAAARESLARFLSGELETACLKNFLRKGTLTAARWERLRKRVFVIHERMSGETVLRRLARCVHERHAAQLRVRLAGHENLCGVALFEKLNASLPVHHRVRKLGDVREPVFARICSAP